MKKIKTLIVDNYDSFTANLYQMCAEVNSLEPLVVRNDQIQWEKISDLEIDNIILSPGPGHPEKERDFGVCREIIEKANVPILGVCLGHQGIASSFGGEVKKAPEVMHGRSSDIYHSGDILFKGIPSPFSAVRYHSLLVDNESLPTELEKTAWTKEGVVMGLRHRYRPIYGVQFHPESICTIGGFKLLDNFKELTEFFWDSPHIQVKDGTTTTIASFIPSDEPATRSKYGYITYTKKIEFLKDPEDIFMKLFSDSSYAFWLDSSLVEDGLSRFSYMGNAEGPHSYIIEFDVDNNQISVNNRSDIRTVDGDLLEYLRLELACGSTPCPELPFPFQGGYVGYFGYEMKAICGSSNLHSSDLDDASLVFSDRLIIFDHKLQDIYLLCLIKSKEEEKDVYKWWYEIEEAISSIKEATPINKGFKRQPVKFELGRGKSRYLEDIETCFSKIRDGESYEICLTDHMKTAFTPVPIDLYRTLRRQNPAPYAAYIKFPKVAIACSSPERFIRIDANRQVESKPIKGTAKRSSDPIQDAAIKRSLKESIKERAENLMIVDLLRNDLGVCCDIGSVNVPKLMDIESYSTVHQMVSTVRGRLRDDVSACNFIRYAFPGGSMTGAPKIRTMEILDSVEDEARGIYSGSIGFLSLNGAVDLNIVIRTAVLTDEETTIGVGGAITALSNPEEELEEILLKSKSVVSAIATVVTGDPTLFFFDSCTTGKIQDFTLNR
jgi:para-aminobenzoate synthetase